MQFVYLRPIKSTLLWLLLSIALLACSDKSVKVPSAPPEPTATPTLAAHETPTQTRPAETPTPPESASPTPFPTPPNLLGDGWLPPHAVLRIGSYPGVIQRDPTTGEMVWGAQTGWRTSERTTSPDGQWIAASVRENSIYVWDASTGELQVSSEHEGLWLYAYSWSPDSRYLAASFAGDYQTSDEFVVLDVQAGEIAYRVDDLTGLVARILWTSDSRLLITGDYTSSSVTVREAASGRVLQRMTYDAYIASVAFLHLSPDESMLAAVYGDRECPACALEAAVIWNVQTGEQIREFESSALWDVAFSPDGTQLATSATTSNWDFDLSKSILIWDIETGDLALELTLPYEVDDYDEVEQGMWSPDGSYFAAILGPYLGVWNATTGSLIRSFNIPPRSYGTLAWSEDGQALSYGDRRWNVATGQSTLLPPTPTPAPSMPPSLYPVTDVVWSKDGATLITASGLHSANIDVWDARTGSHQMHIDVAGIETEWELYATPSITLSPDGRSLVAASIGMERGYGLEEGRAITLWDVKSGSLIRMISEPAERVNDAAWSPDGHILATASDTGVTLWDTTTWDEVYQDGVSACCVAWSPDGSYLAIGRGSRAEILDPITGEVIQTSGFYLGQSSNRVTALTWSPAGTDLAVAVGGTTAIWNLQTDERPFMLERQGLMIPSIAWSPDGTLLAVATGVTPIPWPVGFSGAFFEPGLWGDHTLVVWDIATGEPRQVLYGHAAEIEVVTWSPDGTLLASGSFDGSVLIWDIK